MPLNYYKAFEKVTEVWTDAGEGGAQGMRSDAAEGGDCGGFYGLWSKAGVAVGCGCIFNPGLFSI